MTNQPKVKEEKEVPKDIFCDKCDFPITGKDANDKYICHCNKPLQAVDANKEVETLNEAALRLYPLGTKSHDTLRAEFYKGAQWQQSQSVESSTNMGVRFFNKADIHKEMQEKLAPEDEQPSLESIVGFVLEYFEANNYKVIQHGNKTKMGFYAKEADTPKLKADIIKELKK